MQERTYHIRGVAPLLQHNPQLADPLNKRARELSEISGKRKKTEADYEKMSRVEFFGGLYCNSKGPYVPSKWLEKMLRDAAAQERMGKKVLAGLIVMDDSPIIYKGPKDPEKLFKLGEQFISRDTVRVGAARVMRTRPIFREWELEFTVHFNEEILNKEQVDRFVFVAGRICGLGDWRPRHGRFEVVG